MPNQNLGPASGLRGNPKCSSNLRGCQYFIWRQALNTGADLLDGHNYSAAELIMGQNRLRTQGSGFGLRSKPLPIFHRSDERFDHFGSDEVAVELVQLVQPKLVAGVV